VSLREPPPVPEAADAVIPVDAVPVGVRIDAIGEPAEVFRDGLRLGTTPLTLESYVGEDVAIELRRGDTSAPIRFQTTPGKRAYTVSIP
jgi:hypothetical protein